jgi:ribosomal protein L11 methylase PrmA
MQKKQASASQKKQGMSKQKLTHLLYGLKSCVQQLHLKKTKSTWDDYYEATILSEDYLQEKKDIASAMLATISFEKILDMGTNKGEFAILFQQQAKQIIATDFDANCIESLYTYCKTKGYTNILPLIMDSTNPSPSIGWNNTERPSFLQRISADITFALALIHHLAIANNIPLQQIVQLFHSMSRYVLIEFVPKSDPKVKALLQHRKDIFERYTLEYFKQEVAKLFVVLQQKQITNTERILFLLERKS